MLFWTKEKGARVWDLEKVGYSQIDRKIKCGILAGPPRNSGPQTEVQQRGFARFFPVCHIQFMLWCHDDAYYLQVGFSIRIPLGGKGEEQRFSLSLLFLNNQFKINIPKGTFWSGKTLVLLNTRLPFRLSDTMKNVSLPLSKGTPVKCVPSPPAFSRTFPCVINYFYWVITSLKISKTFPLSYYHISSLLFATKLKQDVSNKRSPFPPQSV